MLTLAAEHRTLRAEVRELKAARPTPFLSPEQVAAHLHPRCKPAWWRDVETPN